MCAEERLRLLRSVGSPTFPDDHHRSPADVTKEVVEELGHLGCGDRTGADIDVEPSSGSDPADRRELQPPALVNWDGRLADRGPRLRGIRDEREPTLNDENYDRSLVSGFFLYRGREERFLGLTASRFFSRACRWGFCQERPWALRSSHIRFRE